MNDMQKELFNELCYEADYLTIGEPSDKDYSSISVSEMVDSLIKMKKIFSDKKSSMELSTEEIKKECVNLSTFMYNKKYVENYDEFMKMSENFSKLKREEMHNLYMCCYLDGCVDTIDSILVSIEANNILNA